MFVQRSDEFGFFIGIMLIYSLQLIDSIIVFIEIYQYL